MIVGSSPEGSGVLCRLRPTSPEYVEIRVYTEQEGSRNG